MGGACAAVLVHASSVVAYSCAQLRIASQLRTTYRFISVNAYGVFTIRSSYRRLRVCELYAAVSCASACERQASNAHVGVCYMVGAVHVHEHAAVYCRAHNRDAG